MNNPVSDLASLFSIDGAVTETAVIKTGHINDSYKISTAVSHYLLQRINHHVFKDVAGLMNNIRLVTEHIALKISSQNARYAPMRPLVLVPCKDGLFFTQDAAGSFWRMYQFISGAKSYDVITVPRQAYMAGKSFGLFQAMCADLDAGLLAETIPQFHNMQSRYKNFQAAADADCAGRLSLVKNEVEFVQQHIDEMLSFYALIDSGSVPKRITHNDTKFNNILFDENDNAVCIVDLDTVMPGTVLFDFGDAVRTSVNPAAEDEQDVSKVSLNLDIFREYTRGYFASAEPFLTDIEVESFSLSAKYMTFIMGLRFLTDYIMGDTYYKIGYSEHNLVRTRTQFALVSYMDKQYGVMEKIVHDETHR